MASCTRELNEIHPCSGVISFSVSDDHLSGIGKSDVTVNTLISSGFVTNVFRNTTHIFSNIHTSYDGNSGMFRMPNKYWPHPSLGYGYSFVAASIDYGGGGLEPEGDADGDGKLDFCLDVTRYDDETLSDIVVARNDGSFNSGTVPLTFKHIMAKLSGIYVRSQNSNAASIRVKSVNLSMPSMARMHSLSKEGIRWEIMQCAGADTSVIFDPIIDDPVVDDYELPAVETDYIPDTDTGLEMDFDMFFPSAQLFCGNMYASSATESDMGIKAQYVIPTNCIKQDGVLFTSSSVSMKLTVVFDIYSGGVLVKSNEQKQHRIVINRGENYILHLTIPVEASSAMSVGVEVVDFSNGAAYSETM